MNDTVQKCVETFDIYFKRTNLRLPLKGSASTGFVVDVSKLYSKDEANAALEALLTGILPKNDKESRSQNNIKTFDKATPVPPHEIINLCDDIDHSGDFRLAKCLDPARFLKRPESVTIWESEQATPRTKKQKTNIINKVKVSSPFNGSTISNNFNVVCCPGQSRQSFESLSAMRKNEKDDDLEARIDEINLTVFNNRYFRGNQKDCIKEIFAKKDVFILMPTGGGKSLCFQLPAILSGGVTVVIMPLLSLILDQHEGLKKRKIMSYILSSNQKPAEQADIYHNVLADPEVRFLFVTPEKISQSNRLIDLFKKLYDNNRLTRFVIDEAHCVLSWGHDFRNDYLKLDRLRREFPNVNIVALTATASQDMISSICHSLCLYNCKVFKQSCNRPNLKFVVRPKYGNPLNEIGKIIKNTFSNQCGIIYCLSRNETEKSALYLESIGIKCAFYHGSVKSTKRTKIQQDWMNNKIQVIIATLAFGMGIDKSDIRFVIHSSMPKSLENFYQECGRAGRDGKLSVCILYYAIKDCHRQIILTQSKPTTFSSGTIVTGPFPQLYSIVDFCEDIQTCRRILLLRNFSENYDGKCTVKCDNCERRDSPKTTLDCVIYVLYLDSILRACNEAGIKLTAIQLANYFRKTPEKSVLKRAIMTDKTCFEKLSRLSKNNLLTIFYKLITNGFILEECVTIGRNSNCYIKCCPEKPIIKNISLNVSFFLDSRKEIPDSFGSETLNSPCKQNPITEPLDGSLRRDVSKLDEMAMKITDDAFLVKSAEKFTPYIQASQNSYDLTVGETYYQDDLLKELFYIRANLRDKYNLTNVTSVAPTSTLKRLLSLKPTTVEELTIMKLPGFHNPQRAQKYGKPFIDFFCLSKMKAPPPQEIINFPNEYDELPDIV